MSSSISSSSDQPRRSALPGGIRVFRASRLARAVVIVWIFLSTFTLLAAIGLIVDQRFPFMRAGTPFRPGLASPHGEWLYAQRNRVPYEYDAYLYDHRDTARHIRASDVLFLGNSRGLYAFQPEAFQPYLDRFGLRGYVFAFNGDTVRFPTELIRRFDLRPKLLVIQSDWFFADDISRWARAAIDRGRWGSWKYYFESVLSWEVGRRLHAVVPPWRQYLADPETQVFYRSVRTGGHRIVYGTPDERPVVTRHPTDLTDAEKAAVDRRFPGQLTVFRALVREMAERGIRIILTVVPYHDATVGVEVAKRLSQATGVPYVEAWPMGLRSQGGSHMDVESGLEYTEVLLQGLVRDPTFRTIVGAAK
jgi:hypothetical protein